MGEPMLTLEEAMKELQIDKDELKELLRQNSLRYILEEGKVKIPKMAIMALKLQRMTSSTQQFSQVKRAKRRRETGAMEMIDPTQEVAPGTIEVKPPSLLTLEQAMQALQVERQQLEDFIAGGRLRVVTVGAERKIPQTALQVLRIQIPQANQTEAPMPVVMMAKHRPAVQRVY